MHSIRPLFRLSPRELLLAAEVWLELARAMVLLRSRGKGRLLEPPPVRGAAPSGPQVERWLWIARGVAARHLRQPTCLESSVALQRVLARRGVVTTLHLGFRRQGEGVEGHAWLEGLGLKDDAQAATYPLFIAVDETRPSEAS